MSFWVVLVCTYKKNLLPQLIRLNLTTLDPDISQLENTVDPDQLASEKPADQDQQCFNSTSKCMLITEMLEGKKDENNIQG